ncbi:hypothetical protein CPB83DRAFT_757514 [Crepidotus variabilis]|uniref:SnoaL-like domain-containing protein n=1 Tax=Crepidotus variabilis TaxID=179855 RepID=A0A9P6JVF7_9AGAR|nr:hypothetical protein CPB83DRAFT_757514 [Crepidotus variabilis]
MSRDKPGSPSSPRSPRSPVFPDSPIPTQTYIKDSSILPSSIPIPSLVDSAAGGAHYTGARPDSETILKHRRSSSHHQHTELRHDRQRVLDDLTELYCCRPTLEIFERTWNKDAVFEDPLCKTKGFREYAAQWFALPKLCNHSEQVSKRVMSSTDAPNRLIYTQTQEYTFRYLKRKKVIESIIVVDLDENDKIVRLVDQWDGQDLPTHFGASLLRTINGKIAPWLITVPKLST